MDEVAGRFPSPRIVARRALAFKVIRRFVFRVTGNAVGETGVIEIGRLPGRRVVAIAASARIMIDGFDRRMATFAIFGRAAIHAIRVTVAARDGGMTAREREESVRPGSGVRRDGDTVRRVQG